ncbi:MAG: hypothetical protein EBR81_12165 [Proteobacteria bacterium]|nr:hypothetical protein [Pseudomonadota bacterium]
MIKMNGTELHWTPRNYNNGPTCKTLDYKALGDIVLRAIGNGRITRPTGTSQLSVVQPLKSSTCVVCGLGFEQQKTGKRTTCRVECKVVLIQRLQLTRKRLAFVCEECATPFDSVKKDARFCSTPCSNKAAKRKQKARKRSDLAGVQK